MSLITCSKASVLVSVILMLCHESIQQEKPPTKIDMGNQTCTVYIESLLGEVELTPPKRVEVFFKLYTRNNTNGTDLLQGSRRDESYQNFDPNLNTKFIIHGFMSRSSVHWIMTLKDGLLARENCNVITVDWSREAGSPYPRAVLRVPFVGEKISKLIQSLVERRGADPEKIHIIGLSLGAQIAGVAGHKFHEINKDHKIGRITGLDPAAPLFVNQSNSERLDRSDANFVDVIHTNADCLGAGWPCGHIDFYPNGGADQPGCQAVDFINHDVSHVVRKAICSHQRAADLFVESVLSENDCQFMGLKSDSYQDFLLEKSNPGKEKEMCPMGINADIYHQKGKPFDKPRRFYLTTNPIWPYGAPQDFNQEI